MHFALEEQRKDRRKKELEGDLNFCIGKTQNTSNSKLDTEAQKPNTKIHRLLCIYTSPNQILEILGESNTNPLK